MPLKGRPATADSFRMLPEEPDKSLEDLLSEAERLCGLDDVRRHAAAAA
jgi:hypothetical protein